jgi:predicted DCC family thiol-disulfide oxidoreductase YuxK
MMDTGQQALVFFYAIFWAAVLSTTGRYQPFDTSSMWKRNGRAWRRFIVSFLILNLLPIGWLALLYNFVIPSTKGLMPIVAAAFASLSIFGYPRILHAILASDSTYHWFFTKLQIIQVRDRGAFKQPQTFSAHFVPGIIYIFVFVLLGLLIGMAS